MERIDAIVVGAGVVGLAIARALARSGREVIVLESEPMAGVHASSRNSEVIHAGLYYPSDSLKARLCVRGKQQLYDYCARRNIAHRRLGKLVVASTADQLHALDRIAENARRCGVDDLQQWDPQRVRTLEPRLACVGALYSPSTGIIDSHGLLRALSADAEAHGAVIALGQAFVSARVERQGLEVQAGDARVLCNILVDAAGLWSAHVARAIEGLRLELIPPTYLCKGTYFMLRGPAPFEHLVYPVPANASLGIHLTLDLAGQARFGPDEEWVDTIDYRVDPRRADAFQAAIRTYWPALPRDALTPGYAGIRAKVQAPGQAMADFVVHGPTTHGINGLVCLHGIESPGLTACLALADHVLDHLGIAPHALLE